MPSLEEARLPRETGEYGGRGGRGERGRGRGVRVR